jgi:ParB-like chromosome segregation protein Spo0J
MVLENLEIHHWRVADLIPYARNPRKNDDAVDRMVASIREFGFKVPLLIRTNGSIVDGHLRVKAVQKLGMTEVPVILCDDWSEAQVKAFRLLVNRSVSWADWDEELVALELEELKGMDFDLGLTGFDPVEIDEFLLDESAEQSADVVQEVPETPVTREGDLWRCGAHRVLCGDATSAEAVVRLLAGAKPLLMLSDAPYGISLDTEWRDRAGLNGCGAAQPSYMKHRTEGHTETAISGDTRADWSDAFVLVPSLEVAYVWHASKFTREVLDGLLRISFITFSRSFGTRAGRCSRERPIGTSTNLAGSSARRMRHGLASQARTPPFGILRRRSSSWAARTKRNSITPHRSPKPWHGAQS